ncbi:MAG TPA: 2-dehydropantoate 2-reductase, partial [Ktedonobacteraceae bacterium]|nr:2-dehydropantoate 2-reductase [Ktedonobacteraceae bacterium]
RREQMRIVVIGAGGTGGYYGGLLARAGENVTFLARGTQLEALRTRGLTVKSRLAGTFSVPVHAASNPEEIGVADLVLFCVKMYDTVAASQGLHSLVGPETIVLPIQNGIDVAGLLSDEVGEQHLVGGVAYVTSQIESPGVIVQTGGGGSIELGELDGGQSERTRRVQQVLQHAGIPTTLSNDIRVSLWAKFVFICAFSGVTALTRLSMGQVLAYSETSDLLRAVMEEGEAVARAYNIALPGDVVERQMATTQTFPPEAMGSMAFDLLAGRRLEIDALNGTMVRMGKERGLSLPCNTVIYAALKPFANGAPG